MGDVRNLSKGSPELKNNRCSEMRNFETGIEEQQQLQRKKVSLQVLYEQSHPGTDAVGAPIEKIITIGRVKVNLNKDRWGNYSLMKKEGNGTTTYHFNEELSCTKMTSRNAFGDQKVSQEYNDLKRGNQLLDDLVKSGRVAY